jgi:hypothetical protein
VQINNVGKSRRKLLNSVSNDLLPLMVGQSYDSFTLLSVTDVMLFQHCQQVIQVPCMGYTGGTLKQISVKEHVFMSMSE